MSRTIRQLWTHTFISWALPNLRACTRTQTLCQKGNNSTLFTYAQRIFPDSEDSERSSKHASRLGVWAHRTHTQQFSALRTEHWKATDYYYFLIIIITFFYLLTTPQRHPQWCLRVQCCILWNKAYLLCSPVRYPRARVASRESGGGQWTRSC